MTAELEQTKLAEWVKEYQSLYPDKEPLVYSWGGAFVGYSEDFAIFLIEQIE